MVVDTVIKNVQWVNVVAKMVIAALQRLSVQPLKDVNQNLENVDVVRHLVLVLMDYVVANTDGVDLIRTIVRLVRDVNRNMESVGVVRMNLVPVQKDYVVVNMDGVDLIPAIVLLEKDVNQGMENVNNN